MGMEVAEIVIRLEKQQVEIRDKALLAYDSNTGKIIGFGKECEKYSIIESVKIVSPIELGKIADYKSTLALIKILFIEAYKEAGRRPLRKKLVGLCTGGKLNEVEKKAYEDCLFQCGYTRDLCIWEMSYAKMQELTKILPLSREPEVFVEIVWEDLQTMVDHSVKKVMETAKEQGTSKESVTQMFQDALQRME